MYVLWYASLVQVPAAGRGSWISGTGVTGGRGSPDEGAGNWALSFGRPVTIIAEPSLHPAPGSAVKNSNNNLDCIKCKGWGKAINPFIYCSLSHLFFRGETLPLSALALTVLPSWEEADPPFFLTQSSEWATLRSCHQQSFCLPWSVWLYKGCLILQHALWSWLWFAWFLFCKRPAGLCWADAVLTWDSLLFFWRGLCLQPGFFDCQLITRLFDSLSLGLPLRTRLF